MNSIESPCIRNCCLDDNDICLGCYRSIDEIMQWAQATEQQKQVIAHEAQARKEDHQDKYGWS